MLRKLLHRRWLGAALLGGPVSLLAQPDSATTRIVPLWRDGQLITRVSGNATIGGREIPLEEGKLRGERFTFKLAHAGKMYDFTGGMEKALLSAEVNIGVLHDSGVYRYDGQNQPIEFAAPSEGVLSLEQVWTVTPGSKVKELAYAYVDFILRPDIQKPLAEAVWYSPANRKVKLDAKYDAKLYNTEAKVAQLIQVDWKWYNERKDDIDARVARILRG